MFGLFGNSKKVEKIAKIIDGAMDHLDMSMALKATALKTTIPDPGDRYLAIVLGFADAAGQISEADMETTKAALKHVLKPYPDGDEMYQRMLRVSNDRSHFEWQMHGGRALTEAVYANDKASAMLTLAELYLTADR